MKNIWVISDTHFDHVNILNFEDDNGKLIRGDRFKNISEMNELMIYNWNSTVMPGDIVYHLGDVFIGDKEWFKSMWPRLHGSKRLIVGNHDDIKFLSSGGFFKKVQMWRMFKEYDFVLSHVPLHMNTDSNHKAKYFYNVHGHIHQQNSPSLQHYNVCVEKTDYHPIHIEDIAAAVKNRNKGFNR